MPLGYAAGRRRAAFFARATSGDDGPSATARLTRPWPGKMAATRRRRPAAGVRRHRRRRRRRPLVAARHAPLDGSPPSRDGRPFAAVWPHPTSRRSPYHPRRYYPRRRAHSP